MNTNSARVYIKDTRVHGIIIHRNCIFLVALDKPDVNTCSANNRLAGGCDLMVLDYCTGTNTGNCHASSRKSKTSVHYILLRKLKSSEGGLSARV